MKKEQALQIATNFYTFRQGNAPQSITLKRVEGDRFTFRANSLADDEVIYEIILDPLYDEIVMKEIIAEYKVSDFMQQPKKLSELQEGNLFRNEGDCVIWKYCGLQNRYGKPQYGISRANGGQIYYQSNDTTVYPCKK